MAKKELLAYLTLELPRSESSDVRMEDWEFIEEVSHLMAFLQHIEETPGAFEYLARQGYGQEDFRNLERQCQKLLMALSPKKLAS